MCVPVLEEAGTEPGQVWEGLRSWVSVSFSGIIMYFQIHGSNCKVGNSPNAQGLPKWKRDTVGSSCVKNQGGVPGSAGGSLK